LPKEDVIDCLKKKKSKVWFGGYDASFIRQFKNGYEHMDDD